MKIAYPEPEIELSYIKNSGEPSVTPAIPTPATTASDAPWT